MQRYWDYSEKERAAMTEEQVEVLLGYELMEKGVLKVDLPVVHDMLPVDMPKRRIFSLAEIDQHGTTKPIGVSFETIAQAEACLTFNPLKRVDEWNTEHHVASCNMTIIAEMLPDAAAVIAAKATTDDNRRRKAENDEAQRRYEQELKKVNDATSGVWSDWHDCRRKADEAKKIRDTFDEYKRMTGGNEELARAFLAKAFEANEIEEALAA